MTLTKRTTLTTLTPALDPVFIIVIVVSGTVDLALDVVNPESPRHELMDTPAWLLATLTDRLVEPTTYREAKNLPNTNFGR